MKDIWDTVIVSDNSIFKLIQNIRKIFIDAGLPEDTIENVYGKGYEIKYPIIEIKNPNNKTTFAGFNRFKFLFATVIAVIVSLLVTYYISA